MNKNTRQTKPLGRSTKEDNAGLSLQHSQLFTVVNDTYKYYNEIVSNVSDFLGRLTAIKFSYCKLTFFKRKLSIEFPVLLIRSYSSQTRWIYF